MPSKILITMDDLETAVRLNAALEAAGHRTAMVSAVDDARQSMRRESPDLVVLTAAVYEPPARHLAALARDAEVSTLALLEPNRPARRGAGAAGGRRDRDRHQADLALPLSAFRFPLSPVPSPPHPLSCAGRSAPGA